MFTVKNLDTGEELGVHEANSKFKVITVPRIEIKKFFSSDRAVYPEGEKIFPTISPKNSSVGLYPISGWKATSTIANKIKGQKSSSDLSSALEESPTPTMKKSQSNGILTTLANFDDVHISKRKSKKVGIEDFELVRVIGKGSFGKVTLVRSKDNGRLYAMKVLRKTNIVERNQVEHTLTERKVLGLVDHPFIIKLYYAFQTETTLNLVLEYAAGGELFFHLSRMKKFSEELTRFYAAEITLALETLHDNGFVYRDLKPENILLDFDGHIKLADFGLAKENVITPTEGATSVCGTPEYLSPEVINKLGHGTAVDWWNLGMVTYEMLTGLPPWYTTDKAKLYERLRSAPLRFPYSVSRPAASLIEGLLNRDASQRFGSNGKDQIRRHPFFSSIDWSALLRREVRPPFQPCRRHREADTSNFEQEFTSMPIVSLDDKERLPHEMSDTFMNFTYQDESLLI